MLHHPSSQVSDVDGSTIGLIGGIAGAVIGLAGGVIGTYVSVRSARTPDERRAAVRSAVAAWLAVSAVGLVLVLMLIGVVPGWLYWLVLCAFFVALGPGIAYLNRRGRGPRGRGGAADAQERTDDRGTP